MNFKGADILSLKGFSRADLEQVMRVAGEFDKTLEKKRQLELLKGYILASLFYEPSTRTRLSFETAMRKLGGDVVSVVGVDYSSLAKGETLHDTAKIIENCADIIVVRHPREGSSEEMANAAKVPVINAGDGPGQHPSQALLDLYTIQKEKKRIDGLKVMMVGDLLYGRTVHSLVEPLSHFDVEMVFVSPDELKMPEEYKGLLRDKGVSFQETGDLNKFLKDMDVVYMTRIQQERFSSREEYEKLKNVYVLTRELLDKYNKKVTVMHPLPRVGEISVNVDDFPGAAYFRQAANGIPVRMALLTLVLGKVK